MKIIYLLFIISQSSYAIYGKDSRVEVKRIQNQKVRELTRSIAVRVYKDELRGWKLNPLWKLDYKTFGDKDACSYERFKTQPQLRSSCSGILVSNKHLLVPGDCVTEHYCWNDLFYWMFDHTVESNGSYDYKRPKENFYKCERVVSRTFDPTGEKASFALIELKRAVEGRKPIKINFKNDLSLKSRLMSIGHPKGLPLKVAKGVKLFEQNDLYFLNNSDIKGRSKGTALINEKTLELEGMMMTGSFDYEVSRKDCWQTPTLNEDQAQELAIKTYFLKDLLLTH